MAPRVMFWRHTNAEGLERLELIVGSEAIEAASTVVGLADGGFRLDHRWQLGSDWSARSVFVERWNAAGHGALFLERHGAGWHVDGRPRPDLDGAEEPDLSVTPFCNTLPIRKMRRDAGAEHTLDTAYIDGPALSVARSRQRYERIAENRLRYVDLGLSAGFHALLDVDAEGLVLRYEHLFQRVSPS